MRTRVAGLLLIPAAVLGGCAGGRDTALTAAAAAGDRPELVRLVAAGADPDEVDGRGWSPLIWAVRNGHFKLVPLLAGQGAAVDARAADDRGWPALMHAVAARELDAVRALLNAGADPNVAGNDGTTALMLAAGYGYFRTTRVLLERGADPALRNESGETALARAVRGVVELDHITLGSCQTDTVRVLTRASPEPRLAENSWPMRLARWKRCSEILELAGAG